MRDAKCAEKTTTRISAPIEEKEKRDFCNSIILQPSSYWWTGKICQPNIQSDHMQIFP